MFGSERSTLSLPSRVVGRRGDHNRNFFSRLGDCITMWGLFSQRKYCEPLSNGVNIITTFVEELPAKEELNQPELTMDQR